MSKTKNLFFVINDFQIKLERLSAASIRPTASPRGNVIKNVSDLLIFVLNKRVCWTRLEKLAKDKYSSLLRKLAKYGQKSFITLGPGRIRLRYKCLQGTNTLAYFVFS